MKNDEHALTQFVTTLAKLQQEVNTLNESVANHLGYDPDAIHWGHVGTAQHILTLVQEINAELA